jgi:regulation of enolase protein 1 (concanavalin A-like superfamily)
MSRIQPFVLRCALFVCICVVFGLRLSAAERTLFEEKFSGQLSPGWSWIDEQHEGWRLADGNLELKVVPVSEGLFSGGRKHPNVLLRDPGVPGDFAVEVQLQSRPTSNLEHAGILIYFDGDNYVAINKEVLGGDLGSPSGKAEIVMVSEQAAKPVVREKAYEHEDVCLRLSVVGKKVTGQFRHYDSDEWQTLGELDVPTQASGKVGLFAGRPPKNADRWARFSHFRITSGSAPSKIKDEKASAATLVPKKRTIAVNVPLAVQAREAAERSIPYLENDGVAWIKDRKCVTCHYVGFMVWSFHDARQRGFDIDQEKLAEWTNWSLAGGKGAGVEGMGQLLVARNRTDTSEKTAKIIEGLRDAMLAKQNKDGSWDPGGQLPSQKRPVPETKQVSTMWTVVALASLDKQGEALVKSRENALKWLRDNSPRDKDPPLSNEWYVARMLVEKQFGESTEVDKLRENILAAQQSDGGWGWLRADKSDAFATGQSLYGLATIGVPSSHPAVQKAWKFLIETQTDNGSWLVNGTKKEHKDKVHAFSSFWGSAWALIGLAKSLPDSAMHATSTASISPR